MRGDGPPRPSAVGRGRRNVQATTANTILTVTGTVTTGAIRASGLQPWLGYRTTARLVEDAPVRRCGRCREHQHDRRRL